MVSRTQMISMLKDAANAIVKKLTLVLQLSKKESDRDEHAAGRGRDADCDLTAVGNNVPGACARS